MNIAVFGIGRVGLPLAIYFAEHGQQVIGVDINADVVNNLQKGIMPFYEEGAEELMKKHINKLFTVTTNSQEAVKKSDVLILTLGTPVDEHINPVFSQIEKVLINIAPHLQKNQILILRSTVSPGATEYLKRFIEKNTKFKVGSDFFLAFCPERIAQGFSLEELKEIPTIIGSLDKESAKRAEAVFRAFSDKIMHTDARSAELAKLFTNMYRYINFAIANEFMMLADAHERSIYEIIDLVNKDYKRGGLKVPGLTAGPCLFKDGFFLINKIPFTELIMNSWKLNESVPAYLIEKIKKTKTKEPGSGLPPSLADFTPWTEKKTGRARKWPTMPWFWAGAFMPKARRRPLRRPITAEKAMSLFRPMSSRETANPSARLKTATRLFFSICGPTGRASWPSRLSKSISRKKMPAISSAKKF